MPIRLRILYASTRQEPRPRRITLILHDQQPGIVLYQFVTRAEEVGGEFKQIPLADMGSDTLFDWMQDYFG
ncbi:hypothetical protein [Halopseudomonas sp.]|uniref:hypothetical protein n=1 Tax=Halopseudomonas sp. TaxID=2901191 RepID=UPI0035654CBD